MQSRYGKILLGIGALLAVGASTPALAGTEARPSIDIPQPGVAEVIEYEAPFVRSAYTEEGYVVVGFQPANRSIGDEWMILDVGATVFDRLPRFELSRAAFSLATPDGKLLPMATVYEQREARLQKTAKLPRDGVAYFPRRGYTLCNLGFFPSLSSFEWPFEAVELNPDRACIGRIYFRVPGGIALGEHWLEVKFADSLVRVPFTIMRPEEEKYLEANFREIRQQVDEAFAPKS